MQREVAARVGIDVRDVESVLEKERHEDAGRGDDARRERGVGSCARERPYPPRSARREIRRRRGEARSRRAQRAATPGQKYIRDEVSRVGGRRSTGA